MLVFAYLPSGARGVDALAKRSHDVAFSTYLGGSEGDLSRDVACDWAGNVIVVGLTMSSDFPVSAEAHQRKYGGNGDAFVTKFSPEGRIVWSTCFGGPNFDNAYAVEVDDRGFVYIAGRAGDSLPTTPGVLQPRFGGDVLANEHSAYGKQDGYIAKFTPDGALIWSTYFGGADEGFIRDIDVDDSGNVFVMMPGVKRPFPHITTGAFQTKLQGDFDMVVAKTSEDGRRVIWASYLGGSGEDGGGPSLRVDKVAGCVYALGVTNSHDFPTPNGFQKRLSGRHDVCLAKFSPDGKELLFGTYLGGSGDEGLETHNIAVNADGEKVYVAHYTSSHDIAMVGNGVQRTFGGGGGEIIVWNIGSRGKLLANTYLGGSGGEGVQGIEVDAAGNVYLSIPGTTSTDFPMTSDAWQSVSRGGSEAAWAKLSPDLSRLIYSTYLGGSGSDETRCAALDSRGTFVFAGQTTSRDWPTVNAHQRVFGGGNLDGVVARFD